MESIGIVRSIDYLGKVVIPKETRKRLDINTNDSLEFYLEDDKVIIKKYVPGCVFCGQARNTIIFKGKVVCRKCIDEL